jgi:hypothetical protein
MGIPDILGTLSSPPEIFRVMCLGCKTIAKHAKCGFLDGVARSALRSG